MACFGSSKGRLARLVCLGMCLAAGTAGAGDPVLARVLSVASDKVVLDIQGAADRSPVTVLVRQAELPPGIEPGSLVKVWPGPGGLAVGGRVVSADRDLSEQDRTGVRSRLMHGVGRGFAGGRGGR